ncbi:TonB-dependent receptor SusC [Pedobacter sp. Bi27]|uniref:SusC/RagA family TonB-linked outer membrane protein n=1 Tax=Pedobacter sp. Bi27 TaxID=2822351 RepID=UPI001D76277E|nr:SusC/RagA family TonB-linked outer membrane protein [Pedobacter sp. Bi27]CAH0276267.1 TonB-dependent receptor SusC [Pedobacter sp. Bi27]
MKLFFTHLIVCFVLLSSLQAFAQNTIRGKITDSKDKQALIGATIKLKGTKIGTSTNGKGEFNLNLSQKADSIIIHFQGYLEQVVAINNRSEINVELKEDVHLLADVVVTGVAEGTSRKKLTFALTKVNNDQINTVPATDASQTLRGKVAGIQISQSSGNSGATVYLRGAKSVSGNIAPLLVVDGFVTALNLSDLNPQDIESIEVVKGAAASALYGTRGEGGIIQVLTKKGKGTGKVNIIVDNEFGLSNVQNTPPTSQFHHFKVNSDGSFVLNGNARTIDVQANGYSLNLHPYPNVYDNVANMLNNNPYFTNFVSASTAGDKYTLYASFQNQYKGGVAEPVGADKRQTALFNFGYKPDKNLEINLSLQYFNNKTPSSSISSSGSGSLLYATSLYEPFINLQERDASGKYAFKPYGFDIQNFNVNNPFYQLSYREYENNSDNLLAGIKVKYQFTDKLNAEVYTSIQNENYNETDYYPIGFQTISADITRNNGYYGEQTSKTTSKNGQAQLNYNNKFNDFDFGATLKAVYEENRITSLSGSGYNLSAPVKSLAAASADSRSIGSTWEQTVNYGYFLNLKAAWKEKIFVDVLGRLDNSSRFGADVGTAFFPRVSTAYRLTEDVKLGIINELKLRAAYGKAGSLPPFGAKDSQVSLSSSGGVSYNQRENTDLKRAITSELEFGIDAQLFKRINVQANYAFSKSINDFILVPAFPPTTGSARIYGNLGAVKSNSLELEINGNVITKNAFTWNTGITFSRIRSKITSLGDVPEFTDGDFRKAPGVSPFAFYGYSVLTGLDQLETNAQGLVTNAAGGIYKLSDFAVNQLGFVVLKSQQGMAAETPLLYQNAATGNSKIIGDAQPDFIVGFSNTFNIGPLSLYAVLDWKKGGQKYNETQQYLTYQYRSPFSDQAAQAGLPLAFTTAVFNAQQTTDYWLQNSSYVSLREVSLSYKLPLKAIGIHRVLSNARLALVGRNLYTWTSFTGVTPEGNQDFYDYPTYRIYSAKLTLNF